MGSACNENISCSQHLHYISPVKIIHHLHLWPAKYNTGCCGKAKVEGGWVGKAWESGAEKQAPQWKRNINNCQQPIYQICLATAALWSRNMAVRQLGELVEKNWCSGTALRMCAWPHLGQNKIKSSSFYLLPSHFSLLPKERKLNITFQTLDREREIWALGGALKNANSFPPNTK